MPRSMLIDARNWAELKDQLIAEIAAADMIGFDLETEDSQRHEGLNLFMKVDDDGHKSSTKKLVFDVNRTVITGFSWFCDGSNTAYYLNTGHADVENRIPVDEALQLLRAKKPDAMWVAHNAPFEITMTKKCWGFDLTNIICTLQMAVSAFNEDQYDPQEMFGIGFGGMVNLMRSIGDAFAYMDPSGELDENQADLVSKVLSKTSKSAHSYNGMVDSLKWGYGLKGLVKKFFNYDQVTFSEVMDGNAHMGQLTGDQVMAYGADDAYWAVRLFHRLLPMLAEQNDQLIDTFFEQENPMIHVYSQIWQDGMRINLAAVEKRRTVERDLYADKVREFQALVRERLPFDSQPSDHLANESWYAGGKGKKYRDRIVAWANKPLPADNFLAAHSTGGAVSTAWADELKKPKSTGPNFTHYMMMRTVLHDLCGMKPVFSDGKISTDKDAREKLLKRNDNAQQIIGLINDMAGIEQRMKLYLTPYLLLCDPETQRMYPIVNSQLNSRRMAASLPNPMQLAKRGESTYVRGFFLADEDDHVIVSIDWSQIELVLIGDMSGDPAFYEAYGQLPYTDLHKRAAADMLGVLPEEVTKDQRSKIGKPANFGYWYSGALNTAAEAAGWPSSKMWEMTERYRETFAVAEEWRVTTIGEAREKGFITLPDGHRRTKFEATYQWQALWRERFESLDSEGLRNFGRMFVSKITNRAGNQIVNSLIQGSCATLAKRAILRINAKIAELGLRARFMIPIHDELVFSVHRDDAIAFIRMARHEMCDHPDLIKTLKIDATASMGRTFEPFHPEKAPFGQIELDEAPLLPGFLPEDTKDKRLDEAQIRRVIDYLFQNEENAVAA